MCIRDRDKEEEEYSQEKSTKKHALEVNIDRAVGKPYVCLLYTSALVGLLVDLGPLGWWY